MNNTTSTTAFNLNEKICEFVYKISIKDATNQQAFSKKNKNELWTKSNYVGQIYPGLRDHINKILDKKYTSEQSYNDDFYKLCNDICKNINNWYGENSFSFGNAQKLINMFVKYFYIKSYDDEDLKQCFQFCHCPMDSKMIDYIWKHCKQAVRKKSYNSVQWHKSWSNLIFQEGQIPNKYIDFQELVREDCKNYKTDNRTIYPSEYDYIFWQ